MTGSRSTALRPGPGQELLLHAALDAGDAARDAFSRWRAAVDFERIDGGSMRLLPLVVDNLGPGLGDDDVAGRARGIAKYTWAHVQQAQRVMAPVLNALSNADAVPMLLKGWALPDGYGGPSWLRARFDLDLLVPEERFSTAARLFEDHGFSRAFDVEYGDQRIGDRHAVGFSGPGGLAVDLHRRALPTINQPGAERPFWSAARPVALGEAVCLVPDRADLLLMTIEHAWRWNPADSGVRWIADAVVLLRDPEPFDWDRLVAMSERYWLEALMDDALSYLARAYGTPYPDAIRRRLKRAPRWALIEARARARPPAELSRRERAALWLGDAVRSSLEPGSRVSPASFVRAAAAHMRVRSPIFLPAEAVYRAAGRPAALQSGRRRWRRPGGMPSCGPLPLGEPIPIAVNSPWLPVLAEGWSLPERNGVWSDGLEASLRLPLPDGGAEALIVELELHPFTVPGDESRTLEVFLDGQQRRIELHPSDPRNQPVRLHVQPRPGRRLLEVDMLVRNPADPPEHGIDDQRRLGVHLRSVMLRPDRDGGR
ncbi:MAG TPA: nucleotidyltransferase family protein [Solirubrobacterales bacterium]|nr:nucleotidyltransferase family protein [Solirubrobacterales bacterium]